MKLLPFFVVLTLAVPAHAGPADDRALGHMLTLMQVFTRIAAQAEDPDRALNDVLAGRSAEANRAASGLLDELGADMPTAYRDRVAAIGENLLAAARKQAAQPAPASSAQALQARKDLTAMGLRYYDTQDFLEAVKRDDALAVELFIAGRGVNLGARDAAGRSALDIARARGNGAMAELLARSLPAAR